MFTGIVEELGSITEIKKGDKACKLKIWCKNIAKMLQPGDSCAVNGVCLTAVTIGSDYFVADVSFETLEKSSLKNAVKGSTVNLETALTLSKHLGGHIVQGHVDCTGKIKNITKYGDSYKLIIEYPKEVDKYIVDKCSIAVDGISLTVTNVVNNSFQVAVIPHTFNNTNLHYKKSGDIVNLETDIIARYVEKMVLSDSRDDKLKSLLSSFKR